MAIFIANHPDQLLFYKNLALIRKTRDPKEHIVLCKIDHLYDPNFDFTPYERYFDRVLKFPRIYKKNVFTGLKEIIVFKKRLRMLKNIMRQYALHTVTVIDSAWLPVNLLLFSFRKEPLLYRWSVVATERIHGLRYDARRTWYYRLSAFLCSCFLMPSYPVDAVGTPGGMFANFHYRKPRTLPGIPLYLTNPCEPLSEKNDKTIILPFPILRPSAVYERRKENGRKIVIVFGESDFLTHFCEFVPDPQEVLQKLQKFFACLEEYYQEYALYYKPHPADINALMPGITLSRYQRFNPKSNTQMICEALHLKIRATYTISSVSALWSSFFGIPSYTLYPLIFNRDGVKFFDDFFMQDKVKSRLLLSLKHISEIGKIDKRKRPLSYLNLHHLPTAYDLLLPS